MDTTQHLVPQDATDIYERSLVDMTDEWQQAREIRDEDEYYSDPDYDEDEQPDQETAAIDWLYNQVCEHYTVTDEAVADCLWELINDGLT